MFIQKSDIYVFLISRNSLKRHRYPLTELEIAIDRWPRPAGAVLPVIIDQSDIQNIPPYLRAVSVMEPQGDVAAEVSRAVSGMRRSRISMATFFRTVGVTLAVVMLVSFFDLYENVVKVFHPKEIELIGLELCNYEHCVDDNLEFISKISDLAGESITADFTFDVPIGNGEYNAMCANENPYMYAPEEFFFVPMDLSSCETQNGLVFKISPSDYLPAHELSFNSAIRIKGTFNISIHGPDAIRVFTKE